MPETTTPPKLKVKPMNKNLFDEVYFEVADTVSGSWLLTFRSTGEIRQFAADLLVEANALDASGA